MIVLLVGVDNVNTVMTYYEVKKIFRSNGKYFIWLLWKIKFVISHYNMRLIFLMVRPVDRGFDCVLFLP